jgi:bifunctional ADP-heptose synthase (sugar kinase/adenylyltransferase)
MSIRYVDEVRYYNTENDLMLLLLEIKPDVRIIGSDYMNEVITGKGLAPIFFHPRDHGWSVTRIRRMIKEEKK